MVILSLLPTYMPSNPSQPRVRPIFVDMAERDVPL